ncbi:MAG: exodeoxyribonuclease VII small subunit [Hydrogenoanaerobacterium sp.]
MKKDITLEQALERLEKIVDELSGAGLPLEKSLLLFEEGTALVRRCSVEIENAKLKVEVLSKDLFSEE